MAKKRSLQFLGIVSISVVIIIYLFWPVFNGVTSTPGEYYDLCREISKSLGAPPVYDCVRYLESNPKATIENILDHYSVNVIDNALIESIKEKYRRNNVTPDKVIDYE